MYNLSTRWRDVTKRQSDLGVVGALLFSQDNSRREAPAQGVTVGVEGGAGPKKNLIFEEDALNCGVAGIKGKKEEKRNVFFLDPWEVLAVLCGSVTCTQN